MSFGSLPVGATAQAGIPSITTEEKGSDGFPFFISISFHLTKKGTINRTFSIYTID
jgi:hypothetical protein